MSSIKANLCGFCAILIWSMLIAHLEKKQRNRSLRRNSPGAASVYSLGALLLFLKQGIPDLKTLSKPYLFIGGFFFVAYELLFSQSFNGCLFRDACMPKSIHRSA